MWFENDMIRTSLTACAKSATRALHTRDFVFVSDALFSSHVRN